MPFRIEFIPLAGVDAMKRLFHINASMGVPRAQRKEHAHPAVAVVGGGPLLDLEAVRKWPGDIWAINATADFLLERGIDCTFFTVDAHPHQTSVPKRLLATSCHPSVFNETSECFDIAEYVEGGILGGSTSASRAPMLALTLGYPGCVFFGCEGSFTDRDHVDRDDCEETQLIVRADGKDYRTRPDFMMQADHMSQILRQFSDVFREESGGLLRAMIKDPDWEVVAVSDALKADLLEKNHGMDGFDKPYAGALNVC